MVYGEMEGIMDKLTREEFEEIMYAHLDDDGDSRPSSYRWEKSYLSEVQKEKDVFIIAWVNGGQDGGNCWRRGGHHAIASEPEPEFASYDNAMEEIARRVDLSYLDWRSINLAVCSGEERDSGYYGNYTIWRYRYIDFEDVWKVLVDCGYAVQPVMQMKQ